MVRHDSHIEKGQLRAICNLAMSMCPLLPLSKCASVQQITLARSYCLLEGHRVQEFGHYVALIQVVYTACVVLCFHTLDDTRDFL